MTHVRELTAEECHQFIETTYLIKHMDSFGTETIIYAGSQPSQNTIDLKHKNFDYFKSVLKEDTFYFVRYNMGLMKKNDLLWKHDWKIYLCESPFIRDVVRNFTSFTNIPLAKFQHLWERHKDEIDINSFVYIHTL